MSKQQKIEEQPEVEVSDLDSLFGDRKVVYVKYPATWSAYDMVVKLFYAKTWVVDQLYSDFVTVRAIVKPQYLKQFMKANKKYVVKHRVARWKTDDGEEMTSYEVDDTLYDQ